MYLLILKETQISVYCTITVIDYSQLHFRQSLLKDSQLPSLFWWTKQYQKYAYRKNC